MAKAKRKAAQKPSEKPETPEEEEPEPEPEPYNPRRESQAELILKKRAEEVRQESGMEPSDPGEEELESETPGADTPLGEPGESEEEPGSAADDVPEYEGANIIVQDGKEYIRASDGSLVPVQDALRGYQQMGDSTRKYQEASRLFGQAKEFYNEAERMNAVRTAPKLTKEEAEAKAGELTELRVKQREAWMESDFDTADKLEREYNAKMLELMASQQQAPALDENYVSGIVRRELTAAEEQQRDKKLGEAYTWFEENHKDIIDSPRWHGMFGGILDEKHKENPNTAPMELFQEAVNETRAAMKGGTGAPSNRQQRKSAAASHVTPGGGMGRRETVDHGPSRTGATQVSDAELDEIRRKKFKAELERRGAQATGNVPVGDDSR